MASSKNLFILLGVLFALVLLISSEVAASSEHTEEIGEGPPPHGPITSIAGPGSLPGFGSPPPPPRHGPITSISGKGPKKGCHYGCCRGYRYGPGCKRCCATAHEAPE